MSLPSRLGFIGFLSMSCSCIFAKKGPSGCAADDTTEGEEDTQKRDYGADDLQLSGSIDRLQLQRAVDRLPPGYRHGFVLHDVEGFEHNEIAGMVGCSIGNSKSQLHKARMKLA